MLKIIRNLLLLLALLVLGLYIYYGTVDPCAMLAEERTGLLDRLTRKSPEDMTALACAGELPEHWVDAVQDIWRDRPAEENR